MDKVRSTLKQLVRDWSEEVRLTDTFCCVRPHPSKTTLVKNREKMKERQVTGPLGRLYWSTSRIYRCRRGTYGPQLLLLYPCPQTKSRHNFRVLVPGAGLGRLAYDVAKLGMIPRVWRLNLSD
jgi:hypothetical protein